jgi:hypothetical protein
MDDRIPKTRTESKLSGKRDGGPFSAKHARAVAERTAIVSVISNTNTNPVVEWGGTKPAKAGKAGKAGKPRK